MYILFPFPSKGGDGVAVVALVAASNLLFLSYWVMKRRLSGLAIAFCWLIAVFVKDAVSVIVFLNLKLVTVPPELDKLFLRLLNLYIVSPIVILWAIEATDEGARPLRKFFAAGGAVAALIAVDYAFVAVKAWKPDGGWTLWKSLAEAAFVYLTARFATSRFQGLLRREGVVR